MKALLASAAILCLAAPALAQKSSAPAAKKPALKPAHSITRLDGTTLSLADAEAFARKTLADTNTTGAQISILNHGKEVWSFTYGLAGKNPNRPVDRDTAFAAASITKSYFATYVMQLVQRGQFNLDEPVAHQLPQPLDKYPGWEMMSALIADPRWQLVTARQLLSHTSGLPNGSGSDNGHPVFHSQPGTHWAYSNVAVNVLALVVEQKFHRPLDQLMHDSLFAPLGMTRTSLIDVPALHPDIADRFDAKTGAVIDRGRPTVASAAGSVATTADDLAAFLTALFAGRILKPAALSQMLTSVLSIDSTYAGGNPIDSEVKPIQLGYGPGWGIIGKSKFGPAFFKEGHIDGANGYVLCFTQSQSCMSILTNNDNGELAYRPLLEHLFGDTVTPWQWEGYK